MLFFSPEFENLLGAVQTFFFLLEKVLLFVLVTAYSLNANNFVLYSYFLYSSNKKIYITLLLNLLLCSFI